MKIGNLEVYGIIYKITNLINGEIYIGQTIQGFNRRYHYKGKGIERVYNYHKNLKNCHRLYNDHLLNSIEKYGLKCFQINQTLDIAFTQDELNIKEKLWITYYDSYKNGYNRNLGGDNSLLSDVTKCKISKAHIGKLTKGDSPHARKVICVSLNKMFDCVTDASIFANRTTSDISKCCNGGIQYSGVYKKIPLVWQYYDDYLINPKSSKVELGLVVCLNTEQIFNSQKEAGDFYNMDYYTIGRCCNGLIKSAGKLENGTKLVWVYYNEYINMSNEEIHNKIIKNNKINRNYKGREVICITTLRKFNSCIEASNYANRKSCGIISCCQGKQNTCGELADGTPLKWMYYDNYIKQQKLVQAV